MPSDPAIEIEALWKLFRLERAPRAPVPQRTSGEAATPEDIQVDRGRAFWALRDINVTIRRGESVGIIGRNGAGKSTLLKILSRVTSPTRGRARIHGKLASLLEVGTGFHQELSGRENISLNALMLGMTQPEVDRRFDEIVEFSGIGDFIDIPVKHLSSGMRVRLGFSIAVHVEPEILIIDEVLAVGDAEFARKCRNRVMEIVAKPDRTVLVVSHSMGEIANLCSRVLFMDKGQVVADGGPDETIHRYLSRVNRTSSLDDVQVVASTGSGPDIASPSAGQDVAHGDFIHPMLDGGNVWHLSERGDRSGDGSIRFASLEILDEGGQRVKSVGAGGPVIFKLSYQASPQGAGRLTGGVSIALCADDGSRVFGMPSLIALDEDIEFSQSGSLFCQLPELPLIPGIYTVDISSIVNGTVADKLRTAAVLTVASTEFHKSGRFPHSTNGRFLVHYRWSDRLPDVLAKDEPAA